MILNQDPVTDPDKTYTIRLDSTQPGTTNWVKMNIDNSLTAAYTDVIKASSTTLLIFDCDGNIVKKYRYEQSDPNFPFKLVWQRDSETIANQVEFDTYNPAIYLDIAIGTGSSLISVNSLSPTLFEATNTLTINGDFTVPAGQALTLSPTSAGCE